jgi:hypothetical protein
MKAADSIEITVTTQKAARYQAPEDHSQSLHRHEILKHSPFSST